MMKGQEDQKWHSYFRALLITSFLVGLPIIFYGNCFKMSPDAQNQGLGAGGGSTDGGGTDGGGGIGGGASPTPDPLEGQLADYNFLGSWLIREVLTVHLALASNHPSVQLLDQNRMALGGDDPNNGVFYNPTVLSSGHVVLVGRVYLDACYDAMTANQSVRKQLFPESPSWSNKSFDTIYMKFIGRLPTAPEAQTLLNLVNGLSGATKEAGACAAALLGLEFLSRS